MTIDVKDDVRRYAEHVDSMVPTWTVDEIVSAEVRQEKGIPRLRRWKPVAVVAVAFVAIVLAVGGVAILLGGEAPVVVDKPPPPPSTIVTTTAVAPATDGVLSGTWELFSTESGLPPGPVERITGDPSGAVWALASDRAVYLFDGIRWHRATSLPDGIEGGIWLAVTGDQQVVTPGHRPSGHTLLVFDGVRWRDLVAEGLIPPEAGPAVRRTLPNGDVLVAGSGDMAPWLIRIGAGGIDVRVGDKAADGGAGGPSAHGATTITSDSVFWEGNALVITVFDGNTVELLESPVPNADAICCLAPLAEDPTGGMWIQVGTNLYHYDSDGWQLHATRDDLPEVLISNGDQQQEWAIIPTPDGHVWLFHTNGVGHYDGSSWTGYTRSEAERAGIPVGRYGRLAAPVIGPDRSVWTVSNETGAGSRLLHDPGELRVHRYVDSSWAVTPTPIPGAYPNSHINGILAVDPDGSAWIATDAGVARFTPTR